MKTVLITGASSGFGLATAKLLAKQGHKLVLVARRGDKLEAIKQDLGENTYIKSLDVTDKGAINSFYKDLPEKYARIDILVNSAGLALGASSAAESDLEDWEKMIDTNIKGLLYVTRKAIDVMVSQGSGLIINIGSMAGNVPYKGGNVYGATKAFVRHFSRNLRTDLFGTGIKITNIEPGAAETEFSIVRFKDKQMADDYYKNWRPLKAEDIANTIDWVVKQPEHVNIENIEIMPVDQTYAGMIIDKG